MAVKLSERAAQEVIKIMGEQKYDLEKTMFRVAVGGGGCAGLSYGITFDTEYDEKKDTKTNVHGVNMVVDKKSALYLDAVTVDFHEGLDKRGFFFDNPQATKTCGCGTSFTG